MPATRRAARPRPLKKATSPPPPRPTAGDRTLLVATGPLAAIIGDTPMTLPDMMARLWQYVRWRRLIDPSTPEVIKANAKFRALFRGAEQATQREIIGYVTENVRPASDSVREPPA